MKKGINPKKRGPPKKGGKNSSIAQDSFFKHKRQKRDYPDEEEDEIPSEASGDEEENGFFSGGEEGERNSEEKDRYANETADEVRHRHAKEYIESLEIAGREEPGSDEDRDREYEKEGERDTFFKGAGKKSALVTKMLMDEQLIKSGRIRREIASRVQMPGIGDEFEVLVKHRQSVTAVCLSDDDSKGFSASKDGTILQWDVASGKSEKYRWPSDDVLNSHGARNPEGRATKHSKQVLALAVSTDGRYLASGGLDRHVHLWDTRTREHVQAFPGHRGPVSCLSFRQGTSELFSGSFDRSIKIWNVEDRTYINTLFGHQSEVLAIDCLRDERVLAVGRDRTMQLFKVDKESRMIFRSSASSLECCCFIDNNEFLTGSDDGNTALWSALKKKPVYIVKNAHAFLGDSKGAEQNGGLNNKFDGNAAFSWVSSVAVCRGSDLAASGAGDGFVRLWAVDSDPKGIRPLHNLPLVGFVNSLAFAKSGNFLLAAVGQEPRLGRWGRVSAAQNGVAIQRLKHL
ncbi:hypothetical protein Tsubulata_001663 [Turnera subulata]|uniref:Anaphase-promoting complex subunit 4 WD40 domain-containing protein n=1 Tax=Turnera subulata TaxID=218843 RepID=A0A9Q0FUL1_9ROSI|nr:hypothetical protein Tsubulata_001663 [Turnera subulata]